MSQPGHPQPSQRLGDSGSENRLAPSQGVLLFCSPAFRHMVLGSVLPAVSYLGLRAHVIRPCPGRGERWATSAVTVCSGTVTSTLLLCLVLSVLRASRYVVPKCLREADEARGLLRRRPRCAGLSAVLTEAPAAGLAAAF